MKTIVANGKLLRQQTERKDGSNTSLHRSSRYLRTLPRGRRREIEYVDRYVFITRGQKMTKIYISLKIELRIEITFSNKISLRSLVHYRLQ